MILYGIRNIIMYILRYAKQYIIYYIVIEIMWLDMKNMPTDKEKSVAKAKRTRTANLKIKAMADQRYKAALTRANSAEKKLKAYKEGFKDALTILGGKI